LELLNKFAEELNLILPYINIQILARLCERTELKPIYDNIW